MGVDRLDRLPAASVPVSTTPGEDDVAAVVQALVQANKERLFPGEPNVAVVGVELGPRKYFNENRFHRAVTVQFRKAGEAGSLLLWLKFRPALDRLYPVLLGLYEQLGGQLIPAPYFAWHSGDEHTALLASAFIRGTPLRDKLLRLAAVKQSHRLEATFEAHGAKMRRFHDASAVGEAIYAQEVVALVERAVAATPHLDAVEKTAVLEHARKAGQILGLRALPTVRNHNDWILRNIVIAPDGEDYLIDCDSMRYRPNWRWYDVAFLLLNVESSEKWAPLVTLRTVTPLWRVFWKGYLGGRGTPDGLSAPELTAIFYLVRLHWLFDGVVRRPNFDVMTGRLNRRFMGNLKRSLAAGEYSQLDFLKTV